MTAAKQYHIFGQGISHSLSPAIHNAAFAYHGLPHRYDIREYDSTDEIQPLINDARFGGASITMPHKLSVSKFCTEQSDSALQIATINTLIIDQDGAGGLVFGAGDAGRAAVYAMFKANMDKIYICNRTLSKAKAIARDFVDLCGAIHCITDPADVPELPDVIIGTIPAETTNETWFNHLFQKE